MKITNADNMKSKKKYHFTCISSLNGAEPMVEESYFSIWPGIDTGGSVRVKVRRNCGDSKDEILIDGRGNFVTMESYSKPERQYNYHVFDNEAESIEFQRLLPKIF